MTATVAEPPWIGEPDEMLHPAWCSPAHCRADRVARSHESAPLEVAGVMVTVTRSVIGNLSDAVVMIDSDASGEGPSVVLKIGEVPALADLLLTLHRRR
jgi:hypothetical protein